jgi:ATP-dependent Clp protease ATP-binding subunit ClpC
MPKINVYLPDDLAIAVRETGIPVSAVCQRALADAVAAADGQFGEPSPGTGTAGERDDPDRLRNRLTDRARRVIEGAAESSGTGEAGVTSVHLLGALVGHGNNLALAVLRSLEIEPDDLLTELRATVSAGRRASGDVHAASLDEVRDRAVQAALELNNNFIGCEHLLLAILAGAETDPATATLHTLGLTQQAGENAVRAALGGYSYAQGNLSFSSLSAPVRSVLEEIRQRLGRLEQN